MSQVNYKRAEIQDFWGEIAPCNHVLQVYENTEEFIGTLTGFVFDGLNAGECVIVIATAEHLESLNNRLTYNAIDIEKLISSGQYKPLDAVETLSKFMVKGWPEEDLFLKMVRGIVNDARKDHRKVRAFGEMVAILWEQGHNGATVQLEHLWNKFCSKEDLCLFCAYPKSGFTKDASESLKEICSTHSMIISSSAGTSGEISYQPIFKEAV